MISKNIIIFFFSFAIYTHLKASDTTFLNFEKKRFYSIETSKIKFDNKNSPKIKCASCSIEKVVDNRINQTVSGVYNRGKKEIFWIEFLTKETLDSIFITQQNFATKKIIVVINDIWFFNSKVEKSELAIQKESDNFFHLKLGFKAHLYLHENDKYYPLKIIDTVLLSRSTNNFYNNQTSVLLNNIINSTSEIIDSCIMNNIQAKRKPFTDSGFNDLYRNNLQNTQLNTENIQVGIYKTYNDFLNKNPITDSFKIEFDKLGKLGFHELFVKDSQVNNYLLWRDFWGIFDGKNIWINYNGYVSVLYPKDGLHYWFGIENAELPYIASYGGINLPNSGVYIPTSTVIKEEFFRKRTIHYLDLKTGKKIR